MFYNLTEFLWHKFRSAFFTRNDKSKVGYRTILSGGEVLQQQLQFQLSLTILVAYLMQVLHLVE